MKILLLIVLLFLTSCETSNKASASSGLFSQNVPQKSGIVFLFFEVEQNGNGNANVKLVETKNTEGVMKIEQLDTRRELSNSYYKISLLDANNQALKTFYIDDPLTPVFESYTPEGMQKEKANFKKAEFSLRYNQDNNVASILIERIDQSSNQQLLKQKI